MVRPGRSPHAGALLLVLFGGLEMAQAVGSHEYSLAFGTWLAVNAACALTLRTPQARSWLNARTLSAPALVALEVSWTALLLGALAVTVLGIDHNDYVWVVAGAAGLVLTPVAVRAGRQSDSVARSSTKR